MPRVVCYDVTTADETTLIDPLKRAGFEVQAYSGPLQYETIDRDADVISVFIDSQVTEEVLEQMPRLRLIAARSTGTDHIALAAARRRGVMVRNVPSYSESTVAEYAFTLLLTLMRKLPIAVQNARTGEDATTLCTGQDVAGKTIGIIGTGAIGSKMAHMAAGFGMKVIANDVTPDTALAEKLGLQYVPLPDLLAQSDIISLHTPLLDSTYHLLNSQNMNTLKPGVILINTARGELIDTRALLAGLVTGRIGGAGLDTIEGEALLSRRASLKALARAEVAPEDSLNVSIIRTLQRLPNVIITPHVAFNTTEAIARVGAATVEHITELMEDMMPQSLPGRLIIVRHAESEWNKLGKWTGRTDVHITPHGASQAIQLGQKLAASGITADVALTSKLVRTQDTWKSLRYGAGYTVTSRAASALNERDYGVYTGKNKHQVQTEIGDAAYNALRRSWNGPVEGGETLQDVYVRAIPFYMAEILPQLAAGKNVLIVSHGNTIRALMKYLEQISDEAISSVEMPHDVALVYEVNADGHMVHKEMIEAPVGQPDIPASELPQEVVQALGLDQQQNTAPVATQPAPRATPAVRTSQPQPARRVDSFRPQRPVSNNRGGRLVQ